MATWTPDELVTLRERYGSTSTDILSDLLGRPAEEIDAKATALALAKDKRSFQGQRMPRWEPVELERLEQIYPMLSNIEVAQILGRSAKSVASMASRLGIRKDPDRLVTMGKTNRQMRRD